MDIEIFPNHLNWLHGIVNPKTRKKERKANNSKIFTVQLKAISSRISNC